MVGNCKFFIDYEGNILCAEKPKDWSKITGWNRNYFDLLKGSESSHINQVIASVLKGEKLIASCVYDCGEQALFRPFALIVRPAGDGAICIEHIEIALPAHLAEPAISARMKSRLAEVGGIKHGESSAQSPDFAILEHLFCALDEIHAAACVAAELASPQQSSLNDLLRRAAHELNAAPALRLH